MFWGLVLVMLSSICNIICSSRQISPKYSGVLPLLYSSSHSKGLIRPLTSATPSATKSDPKLNTQNSQEFNKNKRIYVIVESPAKARTLSKFLPSNYILDSCVGHIRDLGKKATLPPKYASKYVIPELNLSVADLGIDVDENFTPLYQTIETKVPMISRMKAAIKNCDEVLLATDEDREGEAISWHLLELLKPTIPFRRAVFHEITENAILESFSSPRDLDYEIVASQEARRMLDRLVGFTLSPILWKFVGPNLSAGRVQSCGLYMCVEKEKRRWNFIPSNYHSLKACFAHSSSTFVAKLVSWDGKKVATVDDFDPSTGDLKEKSNKNATTMILNQIQTRDVTQFLTSPNTEFTVQSIEKKKVSRQPPAPFTTSTLQQECSSQLKLSPTETMALAQSLYENSHITYMRTDSASLSQLAQKVAVRTILNKFSNEYVHPAHLSPEKDNKGGNVRKQVNAQEAHEAIRPTTRLVTLSNGTKVEVFVEPNGTGLVGLEKKLYELIYSRTLASVMAPTQFETLTVTINGNSDNLNGIFKATEKRMSFPGYQALSNSSMSSTSIPLQPVVKVGDKITFASTQTQISEIESSSNSEENEFDICEDRSDVNVSKGIVVTSHKTAPPLRYTEASFIRELEAAGVGRPSTYASIIQTLEDRGYIMIDKRTIIPTVKGIIVSNLLSKHFPEIVLPEFTSQMESNLDMIAQGKLDKTEYLKTFYLGDTSSVINPVPGLKLKAIEVNNDERNLTSLDYKILNIKNLNKFGRFFYTGDEELILEKEENIDLKPTIRRWKLPIAGDIRKLDEEFLKSIEKIECESAEYIPSILPPQARNQIHRGKRIGVWRGKNIMLKEGKYGPYLDYDGIYCSVGKNAEQISLNEAIALIERKMKKIVFPKSEL